MYYNKDDGEQNGWVSVHWYNKGVHSFKKTVLVEAVLMCNRTCMLQRNSATSLYLGLLAYWGLCFHWASSAHEGFKIRAHKDHPTTLLVSMSWTIFFLTQDLETWCLTSLRQDTELACQLAWKLTERNLVPVVQWRLISKLWYLLKTIRTMETSLTA